MNATDFGNVSPRVTLFAKHKRLPTDVFEGFGRELSGVDFFMPELYQYLFDCRVNSYTLERAWGNRI